MKTLTVRERKLAAIGILVAMVALFWLGLVQPVYGIFSANAERRVELHRQYQQNERLISRINSLRKAAEEQQKYRSQYALGASNAERASEGLKERLESTLAKVGGELRSTESVDARPGWARASATVLVSNEQLTAWLRLLNNEQPYLVIESLTVVADRALNSGRLDLMDVKIEVSIIFDQTNAR